MNAEFEIQKLIDATDGPLWTIPAFPVANDWKKLAVLHLRKRLARHSPLNRAEERFFGAMESLAKHPAFRAAAEAELTKAHEHFMALELKALEEQLNELDGSAWGLTPAQEHRAKLCGGLEPAPANYDKGRQRAALELEAGAKSVAGFIEDTRARVKLAQLIDEHKARAKHVADEYDADRNRRANKIREAAAERKAIKKQPVAV